MNSWTQFWAASVLMVLVGTTAWAAGGPKPSDPTAIAAWVQAIGILVAIVVSAIVAVSVPVAERGHRRRQLIDTAARLSAQGMQTLDIRTAQPVELITRFRDLREAGFYQPMNVARAMESLPVHELPSDVVTSFVGLGGFLTSAASILDEIELVQTTGRPRGVASYRADRTEPLRDQLALLMTHAEVDFAVLQSAFLRHGHDVQKMRSSGT